MAAYAIFLRGKTDAIFARCTYSITQALNYFLHIVRPYGDFFVRENKVLYSRPTKNQKLGEKKQRKYHVSISLFTEDWVKTAIVPFHFNTIFKQLNSVRCYYDATASESSIQGVHLDTLSFKWFRSKFGCWKVTKNHHIIMKNLLPLWFQKLFMSNNCQKMKHLTCMILRVKLR